jgi:hypothetical protein
MNLPRALTHLAAVGVTTDVLRQGGVDPTNPAAVRNEVEILIASAVAEQTITNMVGLAKLQLALSNLLTSAERTGNDALSAALHRDLVDAGMVRHRPEFEGCLADGASSA